MTCGCCTFLKVVAGLACSAVGVWAISLLFVMVNLWVMMTYGGWLELFR
jgi:hypothetical protein